MITQDQANIAQLAILWKDKQYIAETLNVDVAFVELTLSQNEVAKWIEEAEIEALSRQVNLSRLKWANKIIDRLIEGAQDILDNVNAPKWNRNHIELFKLLVTNLQKEEVKALNVIQNNYYQSNTNVSPLTGFEEKLKKLSARQQAEFWADLDRLVESHLSRAHAKTIEVIQQ